MGRGEEVGGWKGTHNPTKKNDNTHNSLRPAKSFTLSYFERKNKKGHNTKHTVPYSQGV